MKKRTLALIVVIFTVVTLALTYGVNAAYNHATQKKNKFNEVPDHITVCNFGSSHGLYGYNYEELEENHVCFNFALDSQTLSYDERILDTYISRIDKGAAVFLTVSYFSLFGIDETETDQFQKVNTRYYEFLPVTKVKGYDLYTDIMTYRLKSLSAGPENVIRAILKGTDEKSDWESSSDQIWQRTAFDINVKSNAEAAANRHIVKERRDETGALIRNEEEIDALKSMIRKIQSIGATPYLITTPYLKEYSDAIVETDPSFYSAFYGLVREITDETGAAYHDYARESYFYGRYDLFINADHLNERGAAVFTGFLYDDILKEHFGE